MNLPEVVSVAVRHQGKTLWLQRNDNQKWTLPGGHLETGEEPIVGAARELNEEAGIDPNGGLIYLGSDVARGKYHVHAFVLDCDELPEVNINNDPDKEACQFHWHESLPNGDIAHVPHEHNVVLKLLNPLEKNETKKAWKSKDGITIPHHTNPVRKEWDKSYRDSLVRVFGNGDAKRLQPVKIPISEQTSGNNPVVNKSRYNLYVRMLNGGDRLPPLVVRRNGLGWHVVDGNHRLAAALKAGRTEMEAYELDPKPVKKAEELEKGLGGTLLAGVLGGALSTAPIEPAPKPNPDFLAAVKRAGIPSTDEGPGKWTPQGLHKDLIPIAHLESSFGQNMNHAKGKGGEYDTAHGAVGFKPMTAHEEYLRTPTLQKLYGDLQDPADFTKKFKSDWQFYNLLASAHFARLKKIHGTPEKAAFAWRWGTNAAKGASDDQVNADVYVQKYKNLSLNAGVKKSELDKMAIADIAPGVKKTPRAAQHQYDHVLPERFQNSQYHLMVDDFPLTKQSRPNEQHLLNSVLYHGRQRVGSVSATIIREPDSPHILSINHTELRPLHRGKGLSIPLYEALYAHAYHHHHIREVLGQYHSTAADAVHRHLAEKHDFKYRSVLEHPEREIRDFDARFGPYGYTLKNEVGGETETVIVKNDKLVRQVQFKLTDDLRRAPWKGSDNCLAGHCYVASEALWHMMGGPESGYVPQSIQHEGGPHWYLKHKVTGKIIDPTAGQFKTPVPYEKGVGKGFLTKQPSKRAQVVIDRVTGKLNKMALKDVRPARQPHGMDLKTTAAREGAEVPYTYWGPTYNYSHLLPDVMRKDFQLTVVDGGWENGTHAVIHRPDGDIKREVGKASGTVYPKSKVLDIGYSFVDPNYRQKGLGLAAYEALYTHAFHIHKSRQAMGHEHSTSAHATHQALARKHGLEYRAESQHPWKPTKDFDAKYGNYRYTLKTELEKMAIRDIKPGKQINTEHGMYRIDYTHLLPKQFQETHTLFAQHYDYPDVPPDFVGVRLVDKSTGDRAGLIDAGIEDDENGRKTITPTHTQIRYISLRGKGIGTAMYEALLAHSYHHLRIKKVVGGTHSSMAAATHRRVTTKHKLPGYDPEQIGPEKGEFDNAFGDYEYPIR